MCNVCRHCRAFTKSVWCKCMSGAWLMTIVHNYYLFIITQWVYTLENLLYYISTSYIAQSGMSRYPWAQCMQMEWFNNRRPLSLLAWVTLSGATKLCLSACVGLLSSEYWEESQCSSVCMAAASWIIIGSHPKITCTASNCKFNDDYSLSVLVYQSCRRHGGLHWPAVRIGTHPAGVISRTKRFKRGNL